MSFLFGSAVIIGLRRQWSLTAKPAVSPFNTLTLMSVAECQAQTWHPLSLHYLKRVRDSGLRGSRLRSLQHRCYKRKEKDFAPEIKCFDTDISKEERMGPFFPDIQFKIVPLSCVDVGGNCCSSLFNVYCILLMINRFKRWLQPFCVEFACSRAWSFFFFFSGIQIFSFSKCAR